MHDGCNTLQQIDSDKFGFCYANVTMPPFELNSSQESSHTNRQFHSVSEYAQSRKLMGFWPIVPYTV